MLLKRNNKYKCNSLKCMCKIKKLHFKLKNVFCTLKVETCLKIKFCNKKCVRYVGICHIFTKSIIN